MVTVKEVLGLDLGEKRTGIARSSSVSRLAQPLMTVKTENLIPTLEEYGKKNEVEAIAVGLPRGLNGQDTAQTKWTRQWVARAKEAVSIPFYWQDEALTSLLAKTLAGSEKKAADTDSLSAAIILQDFLDSAEAERKPA